MNMRVLTTPWRDEIILVGYGVLPVHCWPAVAGQREGLRELIAPSCMTMLEMHAV